MTEKLQFYVVFHEKIFDECYKDIPQDILDKYFTFIAVNENIKKQYTEDKYKVVNEWDLPKYVSLFQKQGYKENSVIYHIMANDMHKQYKYIGFFQYDMIFTMNAMNTILREIETDSTCLYLEAHNFRFCGQQTWNEPPVMAYLIANYQQFNNKLFSYNESDAYPLYNSYVIPVKTYEKIMPWVMSLYDKMTSIVVHKHFGHIAGLYERIMAFAIGEENLHMVKLDVKHDHFYKDSLSPIEESHFSL